MSNPIIGTPPEELRSFSHPGTTEDHPLYYNETIVPPNGYYISFKEYTYSGLTEVKKGCGWCYPDSDDMGIVIHDFGHKLTINRHCNGDPCEWKVRIKYSKYFIDPDKIQLTSDSGVTLQSRYWVENKTGKPLEVVYKIQSFDGKGGMSINYVSKKIGAYLREAIEAKYYRVDEKLMMYYVDLLYSV